MQKIVRFIPKVLAIVSLVFITGCVSRGTNADVDKDASTALVERLIKLAPRISLEEEGISAFEVNVTLLDSESSLQTTISGQKPDQLALSLFDSTSGTPVLAGAGSSFMFYDPILAKVFLGQGTPQFVLGIEDEGSDKQSFMLVWTFLSIEDETKKERNLYKTLVDIPSLLAGMQSFEVKTEDDIHFVLEGKTKKGGRLVAYITPSRKEGPYTRVELYSPDRAGEQPFIILDDITINQKLPKETFSFPSKSLFGSTLPTSKISIGSKNDREFSFQLYQALAARSALTREDNVESREELEGFLGRPIDWDEIKKKDKKVSLLLKSIFSGEVAVPEPEFTYTIGDDSVTVAGYTGYVENVEIPETISVPVTHIGDKAFYRTDSLTRIAIPNTVTNIGDQAFAWCTSLTDIEISSWVMNIGDGSFHGCTKMTNITVDARNPVYSSVDGVLFNKDQTTLIMCPWGREGSYAIPDSVIRVGSSAFFGTSLTNIFISRNVEDSGYLSFSDGDGDSLATINVDANNAFFSSVDGVLFNKDQSTIIACPGNRGGSYTIPEGVSIVGRGAFYYCTRLTDVIIPSGVTSIEYVAFAMCRKLTNLTIPNSVTDIEGSAFMGCSGLSGVYFRGDAPDLGADVFENTDNLTVYYLPKTKGWGETFGGRPAVLLNP